MNSIRYIKGDAARPKVSGQKIIAHVVNDQGAWGAGFTNSLNRRWPDAGPAYRMWHRYRYSLKEERAFTLGNVRDTLVFDNPGQTETVFVYHMLAQEGLIGYRNPRPLRYDALATCLFKLGQAAKGQRASVHMPRIGCGLAGGNWDVVKELVYDALVRNNIDTYVYQLEE